ncbi:cytochrome P450 [Actinomycetospora sp. NBRC 106375]|uniref:cytochrome P450 n=1 Tax=Actinomycetospora sp. NBRC 106375 TaxID=3032207 RepID=UPI0024A0A118|nr:cytochrome P450 [Actinomycetospora sp. NBRC 106375]GLZ50260.1 cytochrome P450 [Actinomycetospora sp. NBRC 106375]
MTTTAQRHESRVLFASRPALWALLRAGRWTGPVRRVPRVGWLVADPVLARRLLTDHAHTSVVGEGGVGHLWAQVLGDWVTELFDGRGHAALRARVRDVFTEASARAHVDRVLAARLAVATRELSTGAELDVADLARVLVGRVVADLLGLPLADDGTARERFATAEGLAALALGTGASTALDPATVATARDLVARLTAGVADEWAHAGPDRLLGRCRELGLGLRETEGLAVLMAVAGTGTAASAMARTVALVADTGTAPRLLAEPDRVPDAVREGLRVSTPAPVVGRHVTADTTLGDARLRAGDRVLVLTHAIDNAAGGFDLDRPYEPATRQLWFGAGRHQCLGAALAKAELAGLLHALLATGRPWRVTGRRAARRVLVPSYAELRIAVS